MNPLYEMFNQQYIRQQAQQHHMQQVKQIQDSTHKLKDFLDSLDKIDLGYREVASQEFCAVLLDYFQKHSGSN